MRRAEAKNTRLRHYLARPHRQALSYSKPQEMLRHSVRLLLHHLKFCDVPVAQCFIFLFSNALINNGCPNYRTFLMTSTTTTALLSGFVSCMFATGTIAQQIPSGLASVKPSSPKAAPSQPAPPKSWERSVVRMSLPMRPTQLKFSEDGETLFTNGATEQSAELWSLTTGKRLSAFPAKPGFTFCDITLSPDGQFAAALMYSPRGSCSANEAQSRTQSLEPED